MLEYFQELVCFHAIKTFHFLAFKIMRKKGRRPNNNNAVLPRLIEN